MKKLVSVCLLAVLAGTPLLSQQRNPAQGRRQNLIPRRLVQDATFAFYIREFRKVAEVSDEVYGKILPFLEDFIYARFEISQRRQRALNQLRMLVNNGGPEEDLKSTMREIDNADVEIQSNQEKFLTSVDPMLSTVQQAKLRIFQQMADNRVRQLLAGVQNANQNRQPAPDAKK